MIKSNPLNLYHVCDLITDLNLDEDEDSLAVILTDTAVLLGEPIGMVSASGYIIEPRYFTMRTVFKALNSTVLSS